MKKLMMYHQSTFMQAPFIFPEIRFHVFCAGYSAGKTSALATIIEFLILALNGKKDYENRNPRILVGGLSLGHLLKTTIGYLLQDLEGAGIEYKFNKKDNILTVGEVDVMMVSLSEPDRILGLDCVATLCDEMDELNLMSGTELAFEAMKACNERTRQAVKGFRSPFLLIATTSQGQRGLYRIITMFRKNGMGFTLMRGRSRDNTFLQKKSPGYLASMEKLLTPKERRVYLDGFFEAVGSGKVCPDFDWNKNYVNTAMDKEVGNEETLYFSQDFNTGYNRATCFVIRMGVVYGVKYYDFPSARDAPKVLRHDFPKCKIYFIPDNTSSKEVLTYFRELRNYDIRWIMRSKNPNVEDSTFVVNKLLYTQRLIFTQAAQEAAECCADFMRDKNGQIPKGKAPTDYAHAFDGIRMACAYIVNTNPAFLDILRISIGRNARKAEEGVGIEEQANGYIRITPQ